MLSTLFDTIVLYLHQYIDTSISASVLPWSVESRSKSTRKSIWNLIVKYRYLQIFNIINQSKQDNLLYSNQQRLFWCLISKHYCIFCRKFIFFSSCSLIFMGYLSIYQHIHQQNYVTLFACSRVWCGNRPEDATERKSEHSKGYTIKPSLHYGSDHDAHFVDQRHGSL